MTTTTTLYRSERAEDNGFAPRIGFRPFDLLDAESTVGERFREVALRRGTAIAVVDGDHCISYAELLDRAEAVAWDLRSRCGTAGGVVAICQPSSLTTIETLLGALLGEFAYFCLDPSLPASQRAKLLQAVAPMTLEAPGGSLGEISGYSTPLETRGPAGVAALYATSGSTGEPKMVALSNRAILFDIGRQTNDLYLGPDDRFDSLFSYAFSASLATTFGALLNGAEVHCYDPQHNMTALPDWLAHRRITVSTMTVSMLRHLCLLGPRAPILSAMRLLSVGGEAIHPADVEAFRSVFPASCILQNAMASTETRTYAQYFVPPSGPVESPVPIGLPVAGKDVLLLDEDGTPVPAGCEGEIAVRSRYLANGYANDAQRTAIKFQPQEDGLVLYRTGDRGWFRPDGCLVFLGRTDSQAKIRGHRVELDHIAQVLELHPEVRTSVVVTCADSGGNDQLVAYVVAHPDCHLTQKPLRDFLRAQLPEYAVPSVFVFLPELPLNANFKIDRRNLPAPPLAAIDEGASASGETIEVLRNTWKSVLQCSDIADDDSFADLGGDSLNAVRILVAVHERFDCDLPPDTLHRFPTLRLFADCVEGAVQNDASHDAVIVFESDGAGCPFFFAPGLNGSTFGYRHLVAHLDSLHTAYGLNIRSWFAATSGVSVESMAANYVAEIERVVPPGGKVIVVGHSFGGTIAFEVASQLRKKGMIDPLPVIIDMPAVNAPGMQARSFQRQLLDALRNLPAWIAQEAAYFRPRAFLLRGYGQLRRILRALGGRPPARGLDPLIYFGEANLPEAYQTFLTAMYHAMHSYIPTRYEGKIVLLRAKVPTLFRSHHVTMGWETVAAGGVEVHSIPGRHDDCVSELHGRGLAAALVHCAEAFEFSEPGLS
jgi:acyl-CoA synthetase (AMP-forming)/AMP-acid ligase II/thioesterase domain-containing protein/acyl carrier protein